MISFPNAKINLGLDIIEKRQDGFHELSTCFYPVPLRDVLEFVESKKFSLDITGIPVDGSPHDNLVTKAYKLLKRDFQLPELSIHLHKVIPSGAGLGGGSADAASMISMINSYFELFLDDDILADYAGQLGSDCAFFIYNRPMMATGRGEILHEISIDLSGKYLAIIKPDFSISTREAYQRIKPALPDMPIERILSDIPLSDWSENLKNDFEKALFPDYPALFNLKKMLFDRGALYVTMSGSGSALVGIFEETPQFNGLDEKFFFWTCQL
jgi:4-diphosphocytidyl-2-C-methyl-D-erythritol kinase